MSRTFRRKDQKEFWHWYDTEEEFNQDRDVFLQNPKRPILLPRPTTPLWKVEPWMSRYEEIKAQWDKWYQQFDTKEHKDHKIACRFSHRTFGKLAFDNYIKADNNWWRSDSGHSTRRRSASRLDVNTYLERPLRRKHKQQIFHGIRNEEDYEIVLDPVMKASHWLI